MTTSISGSLRFIEGPTISVGGTGDVHLGLAVGPSGVRFPVVIKRFRADVVRDQELVDALLLEAKLTAGIGGASCARFVDLLTTGDLALVLEYVGPSLNDLVRDAAGSGEPVPVNAAVHLVRSAALALATIHERTLPDGTRGIVHRDVSGGNLLVDVDGNVRVADLGIATHVGRRRQTARGELRGTVPFMAPEVLTGGEGTVAADLYSLGRVFTLLLTSDPAATELARARLPDDARDVLEALLAAAPADRPVSSRDVARRLPAGEDRWVRERVAALERVHETTLLDLARQADQLAVFPATAPRKRASQLEGRPWGRSIVIGGALVLAGAGAATGVHFVASQPQEAEAPSDHARARWQRAPWRLPAGGSPAARLQAGESTALVRDTATRLEWTTGLPALALTQRQAVEHCAGLLVNESGGFRAPSRLEALTIVDFTRRGPALPEAIVDASKSDHIAWTASAAGPGLGWAVSAGDGAVMPTETSLPATVRCVRGPSPAAPPLQVSDAAVTDPGPGLRWQRGPLAPLDWRRAKEACSERQARLPTLHELASLVVDGASAPAVDPAAFPAVGADDHWSATPVRLPDGDKMVWGISMKTGAAVFMDRNTRAPALCVADARESG